MNLSLRSPWYETMPTRFQFDKAVFRALSSVLEYESDCKKSAGYVPVPVE